MSIFSEREVNSPTGKKERKEAVREEKNVRGSSSRILSNASMRDSLHTPVQALQFFLTYGCQEEYRIRSLWKPSQNFICTAPSEVGSNRRYS